MIEKNSPIPIYIQLKNIIKNAIMNGEIGQNELIPSETQLAETYNITRTTVRRALAELAHENLLRKEHGKGTFASLRPMSYSMWNFSSFTDYAQKKGKVAVSKVLSAEWVAQEEQRYFRLERARGIREDGEIQFLTVDTSHLPADLFPRIDTFDFERRSLYDVMRKEYRIFPCIVDVSIQPHLIDRRIADIFGLAEGTPLLMAKGQVSTEDNQLVELVQVIYSPNVDFRLGTRISSS